MHNGYHSKGELLPFSETIIWADVFFWAIPPVSLIYSPNSLPKPHKVYVFPSSFFFYLVKLEVLRNQSIWLTSSALPAITTLLSLKRRNKQTRKPRTSNRNKTSFPYLLFGKGNPAIAKLRSWEQGDALSVSVEGLEKREENGKLRILHCLHYRDSWCLVSHRHSQLPNFFFSISQLMIWVFSIFQAVEFQLWIMRFNCKVIGFWTLSSYPSPCLWLEWMIN